MPAAAGDVPHMDSCATDGTIFRKIAISLGRLHFHLAILANFFIALGIGFAKRTLRVNAVTRIGGLAAMRAERSRQFRNDGDGLKNAHTAPNSRQTDKISMTCWAPQASLYTRNSMNLEESGAGYQILVNNSHGAIAIGLSLAGQSATMEIGWYSERVSAAGPNCVGWLLFFRPHLLAGLHFSGHFLCSPERKMLGCSTVLRQEMRHGK